MSRRRWHPKPQNDALILCMRCGQKTAPARIKAVFCGPCYEDIEARTKVADPTADHETLAGRGLFSRKAYTGDIR